MSDEYKLRLILVLGVLLIGSVIGSCTELKYMMSGDQAEARVTKMYEESGTSTRRSRGGPRLVVEYRFTDQGGEVVDGYDRVSTSFQPELVMHESGQQGVLVQYRPGSSASRLAGTEQLFWIWILGAAVAITVGAVVYVWIDYKKYEKASAAGTKWR
ncbi:MAG: hypothetical protein AAFO89_01785 [Planctomycetota bacterium]